MRNRMSLVRAARALTVAVLLASLAACAASGSNSSSQYEENYINHEISAADIAAAKSKEPIAADAAVLWVNGLGCPLCATNIDRQLARIKGVDKVTVDLSNGRVSLAFAPGAAHPSPARLGDAVEDAGFTLVKVETGAAAGTLR